MKYCFSLIDTQGECSKKALGATIVIFDPARAEEL